MFVTTYVEVEVFLKLKLNFEDAVDVQFLLRHFGMHIYVLEYVYVPLEHIYRIFLVLGPPGKKAYIYISN